MWYKFENGEWLEGNKIYFPDGTILEHNHEVEKDGWKWYDEPPYNDEKLTTFSV